MTPPFVIARHLLPLSLRGAKRRSNLSGGNGIATPLANHPYLTLTLSSKWRGDYSQGRGDRDYNDNTKKGLDSKHGSRHNVSHTIIIREVNNMSGEGR